MALLFVAINFYFHTRHQNDASFIGSLKMMEHLDT